MRVSYIRLINFRSFADSGDLPLGEITVLVGSNNAGKSSVLRGLALLQQGAKLSFHDIRAGSPVAQIKVQVSSLPGEWGSHPEALVDILINDPGNRTHSVGLTVHASAGTLPVQALPATDPRHFIVPFHSTRKVGGFQEDVREQHAYRISDTMAFLAARLSVISNPQHPRYREYSEASHSILGFVVTTIPSPNGQHPGIYLPSGEALPLNQLGEGVSQLAALLAELALSSGKLFLIEEPENDLHPAALKALLALILSSSKRNQFAVSTHSNIVLRYLGSAEDSVVYHVTNAGGGLPVESKAERVAADPSARLQVLRSLGYELSDFELWDGWLFLEEASAERLIRDYLIPWFAPTMTRVRTVSCGGVSKVEPSVEDFFRLVRYSHLESNYRHSTWVRVDNDSPGQKLVAALKDRFKDWDADRFATFSKPAFELYYPSRFAEQVRQILNIADPGTRRQAKHDLLQTVLAWIRVEEALAKSEFQHSASDIIEDLRSMSEAIR